MSLQKWNSIEWRKVEDRVFRYQQRIYRASLESKHGVIKKLQGRLINSFDAKLLSVRQITTDNKGRKTSGVDEKLYDTPELKMKLVSKLKLNGKAKPIRRVEIPKSGQPNQMRPLGIPTIEDRAKQALARLALEPEWEAIFEANSYGFRPGRSCHDAIEAIFSTLSNKRKTSDYRKMVLKVDIEKCFDKIDHKLLLNKLNCHFILKKQIESWLKAGILNGNLRTKTLEDLIRNETGTPQGGVISPLLSNIAMHGLIYHMENWVTTKPAKNNRTQAKKNAFTMIRYADDILIIHKDRNIIKEAKKEVGHWLWKHCKLTLNQEKTKIYSSAQGFEFLGFSIITVSRNGRDRIKIYPSRNSQAHILLNIREVIQRNKAASAYQLVKSLKPKILGWGNYFRYSECKTVFSRISHLTYQKLRAWAFRTDKRHGREKVKEKYFPSGKIYYFEETEYADNWVLCGKKKDKKGVIKENFLPKMAWIHSKKWVKVRNRKSPYDGDHIYWALRMANYRRLPTRVTKLLKLQKGICPYCKHRFRNDAIMEVDHIQPKALGGKDAYANLQLLHRDCHIQKTRIDLINIKSKKLNIN